MASIPDHIIREIRQRAGRDLVDIVGADVELKRAGREFSACCPFHEEKTPSFYVVPSKGFFHCQGCGEHGDAFTWLVRKRGIPFADAVRQLGARYGIEVPDPRAEKPTRQVSQRERDIRSILAHIVDIAQEEAGESQPLSGLGEGPISGVLPPLRELVRKLRAVGFTNEQMRLVGIDERMRDSEAWNQGGPVVWAGSGERILAMRPLLEMDAPVIGTSGPDSGGFVGRDSATQAALMDREIYFAADPEAFQLLRERLGRPAQMPIGKIRPSALEGALPVSADPFVVTSPNAPAQRRALRMALRLSELAPRLGVAEVDPSTPEENLEHVFARSIETAGNVFEWQASLMRDHGRFKTEDGKRWAAARLAKIIDRVSPDLGAMERDVYASMLRRITGFSYDEAIQLSGQQASRTRGRRGAVATV